MIACSSWIALPLLKISELLLKTDQEIIRIFMSLSVDPIVGPSFVSEQFRS